MKFKQGDNVSYIGESLKADYGGVLGIISAPIQNNPYGYVVILGKDAIVVHEDKLVPFQGHLKRPEEENKKKEVKIEKRRGGRAKRGETPSDEE